VTTNYAASALGGPDAVIDSLDELTVELIERLLGATLPGPGAGT
jgi:hypothetical protein